MGWRNKIRLGRDYYVRLDTNDYSIDPTVIGRLVDVTADLDRVRVRADGRVVADHARFGRGGRRSPIPPMSRPPPGFANSSSILEPFTLPITSPVI